MIDAAYGTGLRRPYVAPERAGTPLVLAVDVPSGVDGATGEVRGSPMPADLTVTFAALKPGLLFQPARALCGEIVIVDIGLDVSRARAHLVEADDVARCAAPARPRHAQMAPCDMGDRRIPRHDVARHNSRRWEPRAPVRATFASRYPAMSVRAGWRRSKQFRWRWASISSSTPDEVARVQSMIIGPGLGRSPLLADAVCRSVASLDVALVVDGDALVALGDRAGDIVRSRRRPTVLTPHDGEYRALMGHAPGADRIEAARALAGRTGAVVLLKGPDHRRRR